MSTGFLSRLSAASHAARSAFSGQRTLTEFPNLGPGGQGGFYSGAKLSRWVQFLQGLYSEDKAIKADLHKLRAHSRDLARNNPLMRRYLQLRRNNVIGPKGLGYQSDIRKRNGKPREDWNHLIEQARKRFWQHPMADGVTTGRQAEHLFEETLRRDGEVIVRLLRGFDNESGFAFEFIDADRLDHSLNQAPRATQNDVVMGVERDGYGRPVAYHIWTCHPSDVGLNRRRERVPARDILHIFDPSFANQTRGVPSAAAVMIPMSLVGRYLDAELVNANASADIVGFLKADLISVDAEDPNFDKQVERQPDPRRLEIASEHGSWITLPPGVEASAPGFNRPPTSFVGFMGACQHFMASGFGVAYHALTSDLSSANYSSLREGKLQEQDNYRDGTELAIERFLDPIDAAWMEMALLSGALKVPFEVLAQRRVLWLPRGWAWVDPLKDSTSTLMEIRAGLTTLQKACAERGDDWRQNIDQFAEAVTYARQKGVALDFSAPGDLVKTLLAQGAQGEIETPEAAKKESANASQD